MIQRIQTVWLLLAAVANALLFHFAYYKAIFMANGAERIEYLRATNHVPSLLVLVVVVLLPLVAIFSFKNRKRQNRMAVLSMVANIGFHALMIMRVSNIKNGTTIPADGAYQIGFFFPTVAILFLFLAIKGIKKDEKLIKSLDRLR